MHIDIDTGGVDSASAVVISVGGIFFWILGNDRGSRISEVN